MRSRLQVLGRAPLDSAPVAALLSALLAGVVAILLYKLGSPQHQLKAVLGIVAVGMLVAAALRPALALGLVVAFMPFEYSVYGLKTDEVLILGTAAMVMWRIQTRDVPWWAVLGSFSLVAGSLLAVIGAHNQGSALWGAARWLGALILLASAFSVLRGRPDANRRLIDLITCSALVVVAFAFLQRAGIYTIVEPPFVPGLVDSFFGYYTVYGGFVAMAAVLASGEVLHSLGHGERRRGLLYAVATSVILLGVAISVSRGAILCVGVGWAALLFLNLRRASFLAGGIALIAIFIAVGYLATPSQTRTDLINRLSTPLGAQVEDQQRFALQQIGRHAVAQNPLGIGYGNFSYYLAGHPVPGVNILFFHSHQLPTQVALDSGWLGLAGFLTLMAGAVFSAIRAAESGRVRNTAFAAALCGLMAQGLFDYLFYEISMLALWVALVFGATHVAGGRESIAVSMRPRR
ncbi:MAG TPA: O-antigen ligase family protein [Solirubrobacteraceae bacterium]|nr:O-antigen ligase family protein [Solirubrobacteraceae bacterium]